jgi:hypothetical protein
VGFFTRLLGQNSSDMAREIVGVRQWGHGRKRY